MPTLTGLEIYKLLPKTNCKECGFPTCLAFAMALAAKKVSLDKCPYVSEETKRILAEAAEPPIRTITIADKYKIGGETVLFRHEKTFVNPCLLAVLIKDTFGDDEISKRISGFKNLHFIRVGQEYHTELLILKCEQNNIERIRNIVSQIDPEVPIGLLCSDISLIEEMLKVRKFSLIGHLDNDDKIEKIMMVAKSYNIPVVINGDTLDEIANRVNLVVTTTGYRELILNIPVKSYRQLIEYLTQVRRLALKKNLRVVGYPTMVVIESEDINTNLSLGSLAILKYGSIVCLNTVKPEVHLALITLRLNIYTDPQRPVTVEPKLYKIGGQPSENSPLLVTTNFSLTYFSVEPEILNSKIPSWLLIVDTDGLSVLTAWAAEKFTPEKIVDSLKKESVDDKVKHKKIIIPGYVAVMSGKLNDLLPDWEVIVGPKEASGIPKFLKSLFG
ncbi:MAG: acetyl-CoA decarbonylase/synthase complex subunit gamma [Endomicrobia bacterium]|nr:acetyl-CoA decarbonylase/synthase complex subunit gamma [Endomicrobiia bacterium]MCX7940299.1 acetyl-CoA decarbonylase/synthase complex subunit gamma [Endomicrobiia bacterium]MDW8055797.1 acetyl-CoA decarbonylase/synthase complex subunit gamma [Elusimicrobiota bacterium]